MHAHAFIADLAVIMIAAALMAMLCRFLKQPVVIGFMVAGVLIGPHVPIIPMVTERGTIEVMAELGLIMLMFSLGLEFSFRKLLHVGATALIVAVVKIVFVFWLGFEAGKLFAWSTMDSIFLGAMLSISSTTIIYKALEELGMKREPFARMIVGILIIEDILAIALIAILTGIAKTSAVEVGPILMTLVRLSIFLVVAVIVGMLIVPKLVHRLGKEAQNELLLLAVLGLCFGVCLLVIKLDYSVALGAFLIGAIISESDEVLKITRLIEPLKVMFSAIFFVSIGLLLDPTLLAEHLLLVFVVTLIVIFGKLFSSAVASYLSGQDGVTSMRIGMGLAQIGEFSFVIAALGAALAVTSPILYPLVVAVSIITTLFTPYLIRMASPLTIWMAHRLPTRIAEPLFLYTEWLQSIRVQKDESPATKMIRRILWHVAINTIIVAAIFITISFFADPGPLWVSRLIEDERLRSGLIWAAAAFLSLPFVIASYRKLQALAMILSELSVNPTKSSRLSPRVRSVLAGLMPLGAVTLLTLFVSALSATLLPPLDLLIVIGVLMILIAFIGWNHFTRVHASLQAALKDSLSATPPKTD